MIQTVLADVFSPLSDAINTLAARITVYERGQGDTKKVTALNATIVMLLEDVN